MSVNWLSKSVDVLRGNARTGGQIARGASGESMWDADVLGRRLADAGLRHASASQDSRKQSLALFSKVATQHSRHFGEIFDRCYGREV